MREYNKKVKFVGNSKYQPAEITDDDVRYEKRIPIGENFDEFEAAKPQITTVGGTTVESINSIENHFHKTIEENLFSLGISKLTPVQIFAIPHIFDGKDLIVSSPTGTGKTAAYLLPILSNLLKDVKKKSDGPTPFALIIAPTHELAIQILRDAMRFVMGSKRVLRIVYGGTDTAFQVAKLQKGCDILVGTPGRLLHFVRDNRVDLTKCRYVVLDEVDRLVESSFVKDIHRIMEIYYYECKVENRQTLAFSATFPSKSLQLLFEVFFVDSKYAFLVFDTLSGANKHVDQFVELVPDVDRFDRLVELLNNDIDSSEINEGGKYEYKNKTVVFVNRKVHLKEARILINRLVEAGIADEKIGILHGEMNQEVREIALTEFRKGDYPILIATSLVARGLDIVGVDHVINYELPPNIEDYVQRIGRTGRVGNIGKATSFFDHNLDCDKKIAEDLVKVLVDALQEVPEFLQIYATDIKSYGKIKTISNNRKMRSLMNKMINLKLNK